MYSESDIEAAIAAGALTPEAAAALRASVAGSRQSSAVDEESFRLLTGFNDVFVTIAAILLLVAVGWIGASMGNNIIPEPASGFMISLTSLSYFGGVSAFGGFAVAATSWLLAEYFTRVRRMALPSIVLLLTFAFATSATLGGIFQFVEPTEGVRPMAIRSGLAALLTACAVYLHWRRFHVPITVMALTAALVATLISLVFAVYPAAQAAWLWFLLAGGLAVFCYAMWWDISDRTRITRRSDVAFWLHLFAAPMIAHPFFHLLGVTSGQIGIATGVAVILLYMVFGIVALAIDRRALLVSSLVYVLVALAQLFQIAGALSLNIALTALVIGSALLMLSAFWHPLRRQVVERLPRDLQARLPILDRPAARPA
jgi:hypothetical protein